MKKTIMILMLLPGTLFTHAQNEQTQPGKFVLDVNTTFGSLGFGHGTTGFLLTSVDDFIVWNLGGEMGYFVKENFAAKFGIGYGDYDGSGVFTYLIGGKYYVANSIPVQIDFSGQSGEDFYSENPTYVGLQAGYAVFIGNSISFEPTLRYQLALKNDFDNVFHLQMGFSIFLGKN